MQDSSACANCLRAIDASDQHFCPACGQPTPAHRIDWRFVAHELEHNVLQMDRGMLYTLKHLLFSPGQLIRDYIDGRRARHVKPLFLITVSAAFVVFATSYLADGDVMQATFDQATSGLRNAGNPAFDPTPIARAFGVANAWMNHHFAAVTLMLLPIEALAFRLAFWRWQRLNYPEWMVITAVITAQTLIVWGASIALRRWFPGASSWALWLTMAYGVFSLMQFFAGQPRWKIALRTMLGYGLYMLAVAALTTAAGIAIFLQSRHA